MNRCFSLGMVLCACCLSLFCNQTNPISGQNVNQELKRAWQVTNMRYIHFDTTGSLVSDTIYDIKSKLILITKYTDSLNIRYFYFPGDTAFYSDTLPYSISANIIYSSKLPLDTTFAYFSPDSLTLKIIEHYPDNLGPAFQNTILKYSVFYWYCIKYEGNIPAQNWPTKQYKDADVFWSNYYKQQMPKLRIF